MGAYNLFPEVVSYLQERPRHLVVQAGTVDFHFGPRLEVASLTVARESFGHRETVIGFDYLRICDLPLDGAAQSEEDVLGTLIGDEMSVLYLDALDDVKTYRATQLVAATVRLRGGTLEVEKEGAMVYTKGIGRIVGPKEGQHGRLVIGKKDPGIVIERGSRIELSATAVRRVVPAGRENFVESLTESKRPRQEQIAAFSASAREKYRGAWRRIAEKMTKPVSKTAKAVRKRLKRV
jgi:hypothetical protein